MIEIILWCALCTNGVSGSSPGRVDGARESWQEASRRGTVIHHNFWDRTAKAELALSLSVASFDVAQSCHNLATGGHEDWLPGRCHGVTLVDYGFVAVEELAAYALHGHGHHRLERLVRIVSVEEQTRGIVYSKEHGGW